jgi:hypothetical protein
MPGDSGPQTIARFFHHWREEKEEKRRRKERKKKRVPCSKEASRDLRTVYATAR